MAEWEGMGGIVVKFFRDCRDFERMRREMDRLWDSFFERRPGREEVEWLPALDVSEANDEIVVKAEVPTMETKDIDISLTGDGPNDQGHITERSYGASPGPFGCPKRYRVIRLRPSTRIGCSRSLCRSPRRSRKLRSTLNNSDTLSPFRM